MGTLLYYVQEDDSTMLTVLIYITEKQANPTEWKKEKVKQFLNYAATHPYAIITHQAIDMVLAGHINASYLSEKNLESKQGAISLCLTTRSSHPTMEQCCLLSK